MKKVIFGSALVISGVLLMILSTMLESNRSYDLSNVIAYGAIFLFIFGCYLGITGMKED